MNDALPDPSQRNIAQEIVEAREQKAAMSFLSFTEMMGSDNMVSIFDASEKHRLEGRKGVTVPSEDGTYWITVDEEVSFQAGEEGAFVISLEAARGIIALVRLAGSQT